VIVIMKSMYPVPRIVLDADEFAVTPATSPLNVAVTVCAFAFVTGLFVNETRKTKVVPAIYVPLPVWNVGAPVMAKIACAFIEITKLLVSGPSSRLVISSVPVTAVVIVAVGWLGAFEAIVIKKSMYPLPRIVFDADEFAEIPVAPPKVIDAVTVCAFAFVAGLFDSATRTVNV